MPRPSIDPANPEVRPVRLNVSVHPKHLEALERYRQAKELPSLSEAVRDVVDKALDKYLS